MDGERGVRSGVKNGGGVVQSDMNELTETLNGEDLPEEVKAIFTKGIKRKVKKTRDDLIATLLIVGTFFSDILYRKFFHHPPPPLLSFMAFLPIVFSSAIYLWRMNKKGVYSLDKQDVEYLISLKDKRVLGIFLDYLQVGYERKMLSPDKQLLLALLPLITPEDSQRLTRYQKRLLVNILQTADGETRLAILKTLQEVGDGDQLNSLRVWKFNQVGFGLNFEMKAAYKSCVTAIEARAASTRSDSQLLRPSFPTDGADTYLRPVTQKIDENADTLLRAEIGGNDKEAQ